jgi:glycosyltransferase involved in cell wall biosynthesis
MVEDTGGGLLCQPNDPADLAATLKRMITDPSLASQCGRRAQHIVHERYRADTMARRMMTLYQQVAGGGKS